MGLFDKILKRKEKEPEKKAAASVKAKDKKEIKKPKKKKKAKKPEIPKPQIPEEKKVRKPKKGKTGFAHRILIKPLVTEKATDLGVQGKYIFMVSSGASKLEVKKAVEKVYGVTPVKVNIMNVQGKSIRYGQTEGHTKNWRKAIITLSQGESLEIFEGV